MSVIISLKMIKTDYLFIKPLSLTLNIFLLHQNKFFLVTSFNKTIFLKIDYYQKGKNLL